MGRRWRIKSRFSATTQQPDIIMIEHTISKHKAIITPVVVVPTYPRSSLVSNPTCYVTASKYTWTKEHCEEYIKEMAEKGYKPGAEITTKYGNQGTIASIRDIPEEGFSFFGNEMPNIYYIDHPLLGNNGIWYNASELSIKPNK